MVDRPFEHPKAAAEREAREATAALFARVAARRRRQRLVARLASRERLIGLGVAAVTYTGLTAAAVLGVIYGIGAATGLIGG